MGKELYPDQKTTMVGDIEMPISHRYRVRDLLPITAEEVAAYTKPAVPQPPRPAVTAYEGADIDAYWLDNGTWRHCQTGAIWVPGLNDVTAKICDDILGVSRVVDDRVLVDAVADALGVPALAAE